MPSTPLIPPLDEGQRVYGLEPFDTQGAEVAGRWRGPRGPMPANRCGIPVFRDLEEMTANLHDEEAVGAGAASVCDLVRSDLVKDIPVPGAEEEVGEVFHVLGQEILVRVLIEGCNEYAVGLPVGDGFDR